MKIVNSCICTAGKYRAWVELNDKSVIILKFQKQPKTDQEVYDVADAYVANQITLKEQEKADRLEEIDKEIDDLNTEKTDLTEEKR